MLPFSLISVPHSLRRCAIESYRPFIWAGSGCKCAQAFDNASEVMAYGRGWTPNTHRIFFCMPRIYYHSEFVAVTRLPMAQCQKCDGVCLSFAFWGTHNFSSSIEKLHRTRFYFFRLRLELRYGHNWLWAESWEKRKNLHITQAIVSAFSFADPCSSRSMCKIVWRTLLYLLKFNGVDDVYAFLFHFFFLGRYFVGFDSCHTTRARYDLWHQQSKIERHIHTETETFGF